jgi:hypothetical protein
MKVDTRAKLVAAVTIIFCGMGVATEKSPEAIRRAAPSHTHLKRRATVAKTNNAPEAPPVQVPARVTPEPAHSVAVVYQDGLLTVIAENATLTEIMDQVRKSTGAVVESPALDELVTERLGPQAPAAVIAALLEGSHLNYVIVGDAADSNAIRAIQITPASTAEPNPHPVDSSDSESQAAMAKSLFVAQTGGDEGVWENEPQSSAPPPPSAHPPQ